ncbi:MAG: hypothetical protein ACKV2T_14055 [Kofleriaceae bacterium]
MTRALAFALLVACTDEVALEPVIDLPDESDPDAEAFAVIDKLELSVAPEGSEIDSVTKTFARGEILEVPGSPFGSNIVVHLTGYSGSTQVGYGRTCGVTVSPGVDPVSPHLFFSSSRKFATTRIITADRAGGQAISLDGGAILVGGGTQLIEQFDPRTGALTEATDLVSARDGAVGALLGVSPPRIVLVGGLQADNVTPSRVVELFDPLRGLDSFVDGRMGRKGMSATSLADGRVIVVGGYAPSGTPAGTITELAPAGEGADIRDISMPLAYPRGSHTATRLGDDLGAPVLIAGGLDAQSGGNAIGPAELYRPLSRTLSPTFAPVMQHPRTHHHAARMPDGSVLFIGGVDASGAPVRALERFTIDEGFVDVVDSGSRAVSLDDSVGVIDMSVTQLPDGRLLVAGGRPDGNPSGAPTDVAFVLRLDPGTGTLDVTPTDRLATARARHQAAILCDGTVFISGGAEELHAERYNPPPAGRR